MQCISHCFGKFAFSADTLSFPAMRRKHPAEVFTFTRRCSISFLPESVLPARPSSWGILLQNSTAFVCDRSIICDLSFGRASTKYRLVCVLASTSFVPVTGTLAGIIPVTYQIPVEIFEKNSPGCFSASGRLILENDIAVVIHFYHSHIPRFLDTVVGFLPSSCKAPEQMFHRRELMFRTSSLLCISCTIGSPHCCAAIPTQVDQ